MGIISTVKTVKNIAKTVSTAKVIASAGSSAVKEVNKGIQGSKAANRLQELESFDFELIFEKGQSPYVDGARIYNSDKSIYLRVDAYEVKGARCLKVTDLKKDAALFTISESRSQYRRNGDSQSTEFSVTADRLRNSKLELKLGGTFWRYALPSAGLSATESSTGYKVVNAKKEVLAESIGKFRLEDNALIYVKNQEVFNLCLAMLFSPIFFQGVVAPENFSEGYDKYVNKMRSKISFF